MWQLMSGMPCGGVGQPAPPSGNCGSNFGGFYPSLAVPQTPIPLPHQHPVHPMHQAPQPSPQGQGGMMYGSHHSNVNQTRMHQASQPPQGQDGLMHGYQSPVNQVHLPPTQGQGDLIDLIGGNPQVNVSPPVSHGYAEPMVSHQPPCVCRRPLTPDTLISPIMSDRPANGKSLGRAPPVVLPQTLSFDGRGSWAAFFTKFKLFANRHDMIESDKLYHLCLTLEGEAGKYMALIMESNPLITYSGLVQRLQKRFAFSDEPQVIRMQFHSAQQRADEDILKWADRLMTLAGQAFIGLPDSYVQELMVAQFCQGALDKDAGHHVLISRPSTLDLAIQKYKWYQFTHKTMRVSGDTGSQKETRQLPVDQAETKQKIQKVTAPRTAASNSSAEARVAALESQISSLVSKMDSIMTAIMELSENTKDLVNRCSGTRSGTGGRSRFTSDRAPGTPDHCTSRTSSTLDRSPVKGGFSGCFNCGRQGHFSKVCPHRGTSPTGGQVRVVYCQEGNGEGSVEMGKPRSSQRSPAPIYPRV